MYMPYTNNPNMPRIRRQAADLVRRGWSARKVGRYLGFHHTAVMRWVKEARKIGFHPIPTKSSKPHGHPKQLSKEMVNKIIEKKLELKRSSEVIHKELINKNIVVSLSSVKRTLDRNFLLKKRSPWKRYHAPMPRPEAQNAGDLVELDTIHLMNGNQRIYVFTLLDVFSRWAYARAYERANTRIAIAHRHSRVRRPNDNAHLERFNRTIQEECLDDLPVDIREINKALPNVSELLQY